MSTVLTQTEDRVPAVPGWDAFHSQVNEVVMQHPVVTHNAYCEWFARGEANRDQVRDLIQQFSVFSNQFIVAQLLKTINAPTLQQMRQSKEILANEIGVVFNNGRTAPGPASAGPGDHDRERDGDPDLIATEGTVDGGVFRFKAGHFEWLLAVGQPLGLEFADLGKRRHGRAATLFFCDELQRIYGSDDADIAEGASFAVEHWAAAGFWKQLIAGLNAFRVRECAGLRLAFFTWHDRVEDQHAAHTLDELREAHGRAGFDEERFLRGAEEMLGGVQAFWEGLDAARRQMATS